MVMMMVIILSHNITSSQGEMNEMEETLDSMNVDVGFFCREYCHNQTEVRPIGNSCTPARWRERVQVSR